jgi:hypothetical protein
MSYLVGVERERDAWKQKAVSRLAAGMEWERRAYLAERRIVALRSALRRADEWLRLIPEWETDCTDLALETLAALRREIAELGAGAESEKWEKSKRRPCPNCGRADWTWLAGNDAMEAVGCNHCRPSSAQWLGEQA